jgi:flagellar hook protein FlgE
MTQGYYAGIMGIQTHQYGLDVISDNLANTGTTGFKSASTEFADVLSKTLSTASNTALSNDIGYGVRLQATSFNFEQGALLPSERYSDLAIDGNGWFGVAAPNDQSYFTRDGHFIFDTYQAVAGDVNSSSARLITADGMFVMGSMLDNFSYDPTYDYGDSESNGVSGAFILNNANSTAPLATTAQSALQFPSRIAYPAEPTSTVNFFGNLGIEAVTRTMSGTATSASDDINQIKLVFTQSATQPATGTAWDITATLSSNDGTTLYDTQQGHVLFDGYGALESFNLPSLDNDGTPVAIDLGSGFSGVLSNGSQAISASSQSNGLKAGYLTNYSITTDGTIIADFSNGRQSAMGRIAVFHFQNDQGLNREGGTYFVESADSGKPLIWKDADGNGITGAIVRSGMLEASNVRTEVGLTDMIIMQRAYQANAKTITTVDEMIQKALSMRK